MSIFNDKMSAYRDYLKPGNTLLFDVDISRDNENIKIVIHKLEFLEKIYNNQSFKINLYLSHPNDFVLLNEFISHSTEKNSLFVYCEKNQNPKSNPNRVHQ